MKYYSTQRLAASATLQQAVVQGLAPDKGLYMPQTIERLSDDFFNTIQDLSFQQIACRVAQSFFGSDIPAERLNEIVCDTLSFETPIVQIKENIYALELFHGPTLAFKDVGARFMARLLSYFIGQRERKGAEEVNVLVATSGDTGSAVANGFLGIEGIHVFVLYPHGKVSEIQEKQFATLGQNITAIEVDGVFDDCQRLVKSAFADTDLRNRFKLTSANSINVARFLPQSFYYFNAYAQLKRIGKAENVVFCVPCGNFGNITAGLFAKRMGLPVKRFIAANNRNDVFCQYLQTGVYMPQITYETIANAMDVGNPSNFIRLFDLYGGSHDAIAHEIAGVSYRDNQICHAINRCFHETGYLLDPHGACGYHALCDNLQPDENGIFLETAHPAKFRDTVEAVIGEKITLPEKLQVLLGGKKQTVSLSSDYEDFRNFLIRTVK